MNIKLYNTKDGSHTLINKDIDESYHSVNGAIAESKKIFIDYAFKYWKDNAVNILEVGFGTGLNTLLTYIENCKLKKSVYYEAVEKYPIDFDTVKSLNYIKILGEKYKSVFYKLHKENKVEIADNFIFSKKITDIKNYKNYLKFDIVFYDAFSPAKQPELWEADLIKRIHKLMNPMALLTTYCAKGSFKRLLTNAGFYVEELPGPAGKRIVTRATKI